MIEIKAVPMEFPAEANIIVGQAHFIKTVEDLYEAMSTTVPQARFGIAFNESSGACLTRAEGNDPGLQDCAVRNAQSKCPCARPSQQKPGLASLCDTTHCSTRWWI